MKYNLISENEDKKQKVYDRKNKCYEKFIYFIFFICPIYKNVRDNNVRDNKK